MSFEIYKEDFSTRYEIRHAISVIMSIYYNDIGKLILVAPVSDYNINVLKVGNLLYDTERDATFVIENTKIDTTTNRITANGYTANWLLNKRIIASEYHMENIETGVYKLVSDNLRGLQGFRSRKHPGWRTPRTISSRAGICWMKSSRFLKKRA